MLELLLARHPAVVGVGEVWECLANGFARDDTCGCGVPFDECPFWTDVVGQAFGSRLAVDGRRSPAR